MHCFIALKSSTTFLKPGGLPHSLSLYKHACHLSGVLQASPLQLQTHCVLSCKLHSWLDDQYGLAWGNRLAVLHKHLDHLTSNLSLQGTRAKRAGKQARLDNNSQTSRHNSRGKDA